MQRPILAWVAFAVGAFGYVVPAAAGPGQQGIALQGIALQGIALQGIALQGIALQGIALQGIALQGIALQGIALQGAELTAFQSGISKRGSDLIGATFNNPVYDPANPTRNLGVVTLRIAGAYEDTSTNSMAVAPNNLNAPRDGVTASVWLYQLQVATQGTVLGSTTWSNICGRATATDETAYGMFLPGEISQSGAHVSDMSKTFFSCTSGTAAKAVRGFGYKPWGLYGESFATHRGLGLWVAMMNAAIANYCGTGQSFTKNGTTIDVADFKGLNVKTPEDNTYAFALESTWKTMGTFIGDPPGGFAINTRSGRLGKIYNPRWQATRGALADALSCIPDTGLLAGATDEGAYVQADRNQQPTDDFPLQVSTSTLCRHAPNTVGAALDPLCNVCTAKVCNTTAAIPGFESTCCTSSWDSFCVSRAASLCSRADGLYSGSANENLQY